MCKTVFQTDQRVLILYKDIIWDSIKLLLMEVKNRNWSQIPNRQLYLIHDWHYQGQLSKITVYIQVSISSHCHQLPSLMKDVRRITYLHVPVYPPGDTGPPMIIIHPSLWLTPTAWNPIRSLAQPYMGVFGET